jgi:hypothetical protein
MTQSRFLRVAIQAGPCFPGRCTPCCRSLHFRRHPKQSQLTRRVSVTVGSQGGDHAGDLLAGRTLGQGKRIMVMVLRREDWHASIWFSYNTGEASDNMHPELLNVARSF